MYHMSEPTMFTLIPNCNAFGITICVVYSVCIYCVEIYIIDMSLNMVGGWDRSCIYLNGKDVIRIKTKQKRSSFSIVYTWMTLVTCKTVA